MRYFYAVFVKEEHMNAWLGALRYLCDPNQKYAPHLTLRGPYSRPLPRAQVLRFSRAIEGAAVCVHDSGSFLGPRQNTVFLHCDSSAFRRVWYKPRLPYIPHLTLYDGPSRTYASKLIRLLRDYRIEFRFTATGLRELRSSNGQQSIELASTLNESELRRFISRVVEFSDDLRTLSDTSRLAALRALCDALFERLEPPLISPNALKPPLLSGYSRETRLTPTSGKISDGDNA
jgi:hypothetical protein